MSTGKTILGLVGSPNKEGLTNHLISRALEGAKEVGAEVELVQMSDYVVDACLDCLSPTCSTDLKCSFDDKNMQYLGEKIIKCSGLVLGTPVYWGDTSGMIKYLITKMYRIYAASGPLDGLPALGIAVAGGSGNGLITGLHSIYHFFRIMKMRALDPLPVTRFNLDQTLDIAAESGRLMVLKTKDSQPFKVREESLVWYDGLPYLSKNRGDEKRLLTAITYEAVPEERKCEIEGDLGIAETLAISGKVTESLA
ncbi:flavodoxin family protein, partial [Chloroflexota bacterium]